MRSSHVTELERELESIVTRFEERDHLDHVFVLGDLIHPGNEPEVDLRNVRRVRRILDNVPCAVTYLLGNTDVINLSRETLSNELEQDSFFGRVLVDEWAFVFLDSSLTNSETSSGMIGPEQLSFVDEALSNSEPSFVLAHHPIGNFDLSDNYWFAQFPEQAYLCDRKRLLELVARHGPVASTVTGHIHKHEHTVFDGTSHLSIGAFSMETPTTPLTGTYAELTLDETATAEISALLNSD